MSSSTEPPLFGPPRDYETSAGLRPQAYPWDAYAMGYRTAAESLLNTLQSPLEGEFLSYPLAFLCRHYLELRIKDIITCAHELYSLPPPTFSSHSLTECWATARSLAERESSDSEFYEPIERWLQQFQVEDPGSYSFRYPFDTNGKSTLPALIDFDVEQFAGVFAAAADRLDAIADYFHEATQADRRALADLR